MAAIGACRVVVDRVLRIERGSGGRNYLVPSRKARRGAPRHKRVVRVGIGLFLGGRIAPDVLCDPAINIVIVVQIDVPGKAAASLEPIEFGAAAGVDNRVKRVAGVGKIVGIAKI
jgi:hypothetical protein